MTNKIIIITGLTASGKSSLALDVAKRYNGEIVSADSVQIYKGLDIGSNKVSQAEINLVPHHLINIKNFDEEYSVSEFVNDAKVALQDITNRNKLPIIVGGTGLYIKALTSGYSLGGTSAHEEYRTRLYKLAEQNGNQYVWDMLNTKSPQKAKQVHPNNVKRIIRYLEILEYGEDKIEVKNPLQDYQVLLIGIVEDREFLYNKINNRVDEMITMGLMDEVKSLILHGANRNTQSTNSIGYREWFDYFDGKASYEDTINLIKQHTRNYCKRQLTFLKSLENINLCTINQANQLIKEFMHDNIK